jgi:hypothetical protein
MDAPVRKNYWIISPTVDLSCIIFGWILFFLAPYFLSEYYETFRLISITFLAGAHRYFTIPLVYMDRTEFNRRRNVYILTPILCFLFVSLAYYFRIDEPEMYALFYLFNYFHFVRQKYGILRIYSGKAGWGQ